jgi:hypothetical protein
MELRHEEGDEKITTRFEVSIRKHGQKRGSRSWVCTAKNGYSICIPNDVWQIIVLKLRDADILACYGKDVRCTCSCAIQPKAAYAIDIATFQLAACVVGPVIAETGEGRNSAGARSTHSDKAARKACESRIR